MKTRRSNWVEIGILGFLGLLVILSLVIPQLLRDEGVPQLLSISVLLRDTDSSGWAAARQGMEKAADELGAELRYLTLSTPNDSGEQVELLYREAEGGADALIAVPVDPEALRTARSQLSNPCPMVTLECPMEGGDGTVTPDNGQVGRRLADTLLEDWSGGEVILLDTSAVCPETALRLAEAQSALTEAGVSSRTVTGLPEDWRPEGRRWVMAFDAAATRQTAERKEAEELSLALYGVGSSTAIAAQLEKGNITAIAAWNDYAAGYLAVQQAAQAVRERPQALEPLPFSIVRREEIYEPENQKLLFPIMSSSGR